MGRLFLSPYPVFRRRLHQHLCSQTRRLLLQCALVGHRPTTAEISKLFSPQTHRGTGSGVISGTLPNVEKKGRAQIVLVNTEGWNGSLTFTAYDDNGAQVAAPQRSLAAHEKLLDTAEPLLGGLDLTEGTHIRYTSNRSLIAFQPKSSADGLHPLCTPRTPNTRVLISLPVA